MNFKITSNNKFSIGIDFHKRVYYVLLKSNNKVKLTNVFNNKILVDNIDVNDILIDGNPLTNIEDLQNVVYNRSCICEGDYGEEFKIFDRTFDRTFE